MACACLNSTLAPELHPKFRKDPETIIGDMKEDRGRWAFSVKQEALCH